MHSSYDKTPFYKQNLNLTYDIVIKVIDWHEGTVLRADVQVIDGILQDLVVEGAHMGQDIGSICPGFESFVALNLLKG